MYEWDAEMAFPTFLTLQLFYVNSYKTLMYMGEMDVLPKIVTSTKNKDTIKPFRKLRNLLLCIWYHFCLSITSTFLTLSSTLAIILLMKGWYVTQVVTWSIIRIVSKRQWCLTKKDYLPLWQSRGYSMTLYLFVHLLS